MSLGAGAQNGWWSRVAIRHGEGGIHGMPASGHHQTHRHRHTEPSQCNIYLPNTYQKEGGEGKSLKN